MIGPLNLPNLFLSLTVDLPKENLLSISIGSSKLLNLKRGQTSTIFPSMKSIVFLASIVLFARASPPNQGVRSPTYLFPLDLNRLVLLHALIIRPPPDYYLNTFDDSSVPKVDDALDEPPLQPTLDLFPLSNDVHRSFESTDRYREPVGSNIIASSESKSQTAGKYFWNDFETNEREANGAPVNLINGTVDDQVANPDKHLDAELSSNHDEVPIAENEPDAGMQEKGNLNCSLIGYIVSCQNLSSSSPNHPI